jgi:hypothetical protein
VLTALPQQVETGTLYAIDTWSMWPGANNQDLVLTLRTPQGLAVSFTTKSFQLEAMATVATYGRAIPLAVKTIQ